MMTRAELDARAEELGINPSPRWKDATVAEKIAEAEAALAAKAGDGNTEAGGPSGDAVPAEGAGQSAAPTPPAEDPVMITVIGPKKGRWRAGRHFTKEPVKIPLDDLTTPELQALQADPKLTLSGLLQD